MKYWHSELRNEILAQRVVKNLQRRAFDACYCATKEEALEKALSLIDKEQCVSWGGSMTLEEMGIDKEQCVSWGGSMTLEEMGLLETLRTQGYNIIDRDTAKSQEERLELLRKALTCDTYFMSTNAMSEDGLMYSALPILTRRAKITGTALTAPRQTASATLF